jgi:hypothetical protein
MENSTLTEKVIEYIVRDQHLCGYPVALDDVLPKHLEDPWLYSRKHGLFRVFTGYHVLVASYLHALTIVEELEKTWDKEYDTFFEHLCDQATYNMDEYSEAFYASRGSAYISSISYSGRISVAERRNLTRKETQILSQLCEIETIAEQDANNVYAAGER